MQVMGSMVDKLCQIEADSVMSSVNPNTSGLLLEEFLRIIRKKKEAQLWNEIRHIFTAFDSHLPKRFLEIFQS